MKQINVTSLHDFPELFTCTSGLYEGCTFYKHYNEFFGYSSAFFNTNVDVLPNVESYEKAKKEAYCFEFIINKKHTIVLPIIKCNNGTVFLLGTTDKKHALLNITFGSYNLSFDAFSNIIHEVKRKYFNTLDHSVTRKVFNSKYISEIFPYVISMIEYAEIFWTVRYEDIGFGFVASDYLDLNSCEIVY